MDLASWDWGTIGKSAVGAGFGTAVVQAALAIWKDRRSSRSAATYLALRVAVKLEAYARACVRLIQENHDAYHPPGEPYPDWQDKLPSLGDLPEDAEGWRAMDVQLADRALSFPARLVAAANRTSVAAYENPGALIADVEDEAKATGLMAWETARDIRWKYGISRPTYVEDPTASLKR